MCAIEFRCISSTLSAFDTGRLQYLNAERYLPDNSIHGDSGESDCFVPLTAQKSNAIVCVVLPSPHMTWGLLFYAHSIDIGVFPRIDCAFFLVIIKSRIT